MFIARQPIFDKNMNVYGYELLYRAGHNATSYQGSSAVSSTATVMIGLLELGLENIVEDRKAFVNFDYEFLLSDSIELISPEKMVIEVLETTTFDQKIAERLSELKHKGYRIALDDFEKEIKSIQLLDSIEIIKYDIMLTPLQQIKEDVKFALGKGKILLAEKIETQEEYETAKSMGFQLFQGYFFSKPQVVGGLKSKSTSKIIYQRIIAELHTEFPSFQKIAEFIEEDVNLAYRILKVAGKSKNIQSITKVLQVMGLREIERWVNILLLQDLADHKPKELIRLSLVRSKFGELIAANSIFHERRHEIALMCLFSVLDAMLDLPMEEALTDLPISDDIREMLVYRTGNLLPIHTIIKCYEKGECTDIFKMSDQIKLKVEYLGILYVEAIRWADGIMRAL